MSYRLVPLRRDHDRQGFDCGVAELNDFLSLYAGQAVKRDTARVFVAQSQEDESIVLGYFALSMSAVNLEALPEERAKKLPNYPLVPVARLTRLAVATSMQQQGFGRQLLLEALDLAVRASDRVAAWAVVVDAKPHAIAFYRRFGFLPLVNDESQLFLPMADIKNARK